MTNEEKKQDFSRKPSLPPFRRIVLMEHHASKREADVVASQK